MWYRVGEQPYSTASASCCLISKSEITCLPSREKKTFLSRSARLPIGCLFQTVPSGDPYTGFSRASTLSAGAIIGICVVALIVASLISFNFYCRCLAICCPGCLPCRCCQEEEEEDWNVLYNENPNILYNENPDVSGWPRIAVVASSVHTPPVPVTPPPTPVPVPVDAPDSDDGSERDAREARRNEYSASAESPIDPWRYVGATLPTQLPRAYAGRIYAHHHPIKMQVPPEAGSTTSLVVGSDPGAHFHTFQLIWLTYCETYGLLPGEEMRSPRATA
ncbi:hypothetical protein GGX14DRAFT_391039 [Mycena pura]|uniref:Uncharacterized protein n=1 Tax=Mycena pura TaxID=153505 RepID=A0AAD6VRA7_9AGAR|nr:hypothetical protein GGX14DRAFT_391039 [Mycena pura]